MDNLAENLHARLKKISSRDPCRRGWRSHSGKSITGNGSALDLCTERHRVLATVNQVQDRFAAHPGLLARNAKQQATRMACCFAQCTCCFNSLRLMKVTLQRNTRLHSGKLNPQWFQERLQSTGFIHWFYAHDLIPVNLEHVASFWPDDLPAGSWDDTDAYR